MLARTRLIVPPALLLATASAFVPSASAQSTQRCSLASNGQQANGPSGHPATNGSGTSVAFESLATNLVAGDLNGASDVFWRDLANAQTLRISVGLGGVDANGGSFAPSMDDTGRFVVFESDATNLVAGDANGLRDVFERNVVGSITRISVDPNGNDADGASREACWTRGMYSVGFTSAATNLVAGDTNGVEDVFVRNLLAGQTLRASVDSAGNQANGPSSHPALRGDAPGSLRVAFQSLATNLVAGDTNGASDVFVRNFLTGQTLRVSVDSAGNQANGPSFAPAISNDGRYVAFESDATNLVAGDTNGVRDVFVRDLVLGTTVRLSVDALGLEGNGASSSVALNGFGTDLQAAFASAATNLVPGDTNGASDVFERFVSSSSSIALRSPTGLGGFASGDSSAPAPAFGGARIFFASVAADLVSGDTNGASDVFLHALGNVGGSPGTDLCQPGVGSVIACPCGNPPAGAPQGCANSSGSGGAVLASSGEARLSHDSLSFTTSGEPAVATTILLQGTAYFANGLSTGIVYGQGVRCVAGSLKRLYVVPVQQGTITLPTGYLPPVSTRSAELGDVISSGSLRYYCMYYRDPIVLGGCPSTSTFNLTQTQSILWQN